MLRVSSSTPGGDKIARSSAHEREPSSCSPCTTPRAAMGVAVQSAGGVGCAEKCRNETPERDIDATPHRAAKIEEKPAGDLIGSGTDTADFRAGLPVFRNHMVAGVAAKNPDRRCRREGRKVAQMRHLCIAFIAAPLRNGFIRGGHGHGPLCHESEAATCRD
jgi:hypothetical protein